MVPFSLRETIDDVGQMASTMWVDESMAGSLSRCSSGEEIVGPLTNEAIDKAQLSFSLSNQGGGASRARGCRAGSTPGVLAELGWCNVGLDLENWGFMP